MARLPLGERACKGRHLAAGPKSDPISTTYHF